MSEKMMNSTHDDLHNALRKMGLQDWHLRLTIEEATALRNAVDEWRDIVEAMKAADPATLPLAARCHSRTAVPGASESPECAEVPTMCSRHAHDLMAALREAESAAATAQRETMNKDTEAESDADLDEDARVIAAATPGPWGWTPGPGPLRDADCAFIVRARTRWPALVAEVWRLRAASATERDKDGGGSDRP